MNYVKYLVALMALCILSIPAFSMPDEGYAAKDGDNRAFDDRAPSARPAGQDDQEPSECQAQMGPEGKKMLCMKHDMPMVCGNPCDRDGKKIMKSMMGPKAGERQKGPEGMQDFKGMQGPECHEHIKSMMGPKAGICQKGPEEMKIKVIRKQIMGEEPMMKDNMGDIPFGKEDPCDKGGKKIIKSMMGGKNCGPDGHKHINSMMGGMMERGPAGAEAKTIIVNVNL